MDRFRVFVVMTSMLVVALICLGNAKVAADTVAHLPPPRVALCDEHGRSYHRARADKNYIIDEVEWPAYGVPGDSHKFPSYEERDVGTWLNVVCFFLLTYSFIFSPSTVFVCLFVCFFVNCLFFC